MQLKFESQIFFMKLLISGDTTIREINKEFQKTFPYLKLEFYKIKHKIKESSHFEKKIPAHNSFYEIAGDLKLSEINIRPSDTVEVLEKTFQDQFGLPIQVCRKTENIWVETTQTDNLTLERQNSMGEASSRPHTGNIYALLL